MDLIPRASHGVNHIEPILGSDQFVNFSELLFQIVGIDMKNSLTQIGALSQHIDAGTLVEKFISRSSQPCMDVLD